MEIHNITGHIKGSVRQGQTKGSPPKPFTAFTVITERKFGDKTFTSYPNFIAWGQSAEICSRLKDNDLVQVLSYEVKAETYTANDGATKAKLQYTVREIEVLGGGAPAAAPAPKQAEQKPAATVPGPDEDVPF